MIKILIPAIKGKVKTSARGFWQNDNGKVFYDYLTEKLIDSDYNDNYSAIREFIDYLKIKYNQEAMFYSVNKIGYIYYNNDKTVILLHKIYKEVSRGNLKTAIQEALRIYKGVTVYQEDKRYYIEVFTTI